ncbi:carbohydrate kinase family protein [Luteimicrobium subarcticum]|uniref:Sugar/nucleoside kinase (Ribokinase family) n=1 Tax=Luteimicrobium subarcticum TaxID=620910 RepID=A0A2M8WR33_9MICO|nr:PfkB family carbohydrate kinase [Luteimicrobium subarcticum]PJI93395.1 sugar/nucleoside kinase (ribokinase family) [Luteimicrobium subarcticum]
MTGPDPSAEVLVVGPAAWNELLYVDVLPDPRPHTVAAHRTRRTVGGTSAGKALNLAALGRSVLLRTVLGDDDDGARVAAALTKAGVATVIEPDPDGRTEHHVNLMADDGGRLSVYAHAPRDVRPEGPGWERTLRALDTARAVLVDLAPHARHVLDAAAERGVPVWCDVHDWDGASAFHRPWVDAADVLVLSSDRLADPRDVMRRALDGGARLVVCTHGAAGATALSTDGWVDVPAVPVERVVDTNGAGDGFVAGLVDAELAGATLEQALAAAAQHAARVVASPDLVPCGPPHP